MDFNAILKLIPEEYLSEIVVGIGAFIIGFTRWGFQKMFDKLCEKYPSHSGSLKKIKKVTIDTVETTYHAVIKETEKAVADGNISHEEEELIKAKAKQAAKTAIIKNVGKPIANLLEKKYGNLKNYVDGLIEETISEAKN